ncbi:MAG: histidinol dehydrogenase [Gemmatimonadota bacterium]
MTAGTGERVSGGAGRPGAVAAAGFAVVGAVGALGEGERARLFDRGRATDPGVERDVRAIIGEVRGRGDEALREMALRFDGARLDALEVPRAAWEQALAELDPTVRAALERAAANIAAFHTAQLPETLEVETEPGVRLGRRAEPLRRVGVYAPGGRAAYPSSVLMGVVPAKVARVGEVIVCSPAGPDGAPPATVLAACALAGADRVFAIGGAGAIAALALGTASVPRVDKVVGPGNAYVTEAKRQLTGVVAIDSPAGPSEVLVIADDTADATLVAVELLAQAEHDPDAAAVLVTTSVALCDAVAAEVARLLPDQPRAEIIASALAERGALLTVDTLEEAAEFAEAYAPEHLLVMTREPRALLPSLRGAGTIFLGAPSSVAFGDYMTGANHVLPTAGLARAYAGLSTFDFVRWTTYQELTPAAAAAMSGATAVLADAEGLPAHAFAARLRADAAGASADTANVNDDIAASTWNRVRTRAAYATLAPYDPGRTPCETDLSDNTNLFGPSPSVRGALRSAAGSLITRYPSVYATELKRALASLLDVAPENITTGCGSDDLIDSAVRAFAEPGDAVAYPDPTFGMVPIFARMNATRPVPVPLRPDLGLDADALVGARARITYLCRPNNPTGTSFDRAATEQVCREAAGLVLLDEAYADFAGDDLVQFAVASERAVVLRTLSKAYGMAGLRIGFAVGPVPLIAEIEKSRGPYKVSGVAEAAALQVLASDMDWVRARVADVREARSLLLEQLRQRGVEAVDSAANFVLLRVDDAAAWNRALRSRGVAVRPFPALPRLGECLRVSVGPWPQLERFLNAFDEVRNR